MELIKLPVLKKTKQYTCGQWSFVYPPFKGAKTMYTDTDGELQSFSVKDLINLNTKENDFFNKRATERADALKELTEIQKEIEESIINAEKFCTENKTMNTEKTYTVTSQNCVKLLSDLEHGTMFIFPDKPEELCMVSNTVDGNYYFIDLTTGNLYDSQSSQHDEVNPVSHFKGQITLA